MILRTSVTSLSRGVRNGARTCRVSNDNTNKTNKIDLRNVAVTGQKGNRNIVGGGDEPKRGRLICEIK